MGFSNMVLGALPRHHEAIALYKSKGCMIDDQPCDRERSDDTILMQTEW
ncbi:MAG: hypothetical protein GY742_08265 [Hyphomicrobiales bacterium]|nr:hypothetical protein [Hyphomicrobiales bacterium]